MLENQREKSIVKKKLKLRLKSLQNMDKKDSTLNKTSSFNQKGNPKPENYIWIDVKQCCLRDY